MASSFRQYCIPLSLKEVQLIEASIVIRGTQSISFIFICTFMQKCVLHLSAILFLLNLSQTHLRLNNKYFFAL